MTTTGSDDTMDTTDVAVRRSLGLWALADGALLLGAAVLTTSFGDGTGTAAAIAIGAAGLLALVSLWRTSRSVSAANLLGRLPLGMGTLLVGGTALGLGAPVGQTPVYLVRPTAWDTVNQLVAGFGIGALILAMLIAGVGRVGMTLLSLRAEAVGHD